MDILMQMEEDADDDDFKMWHFLKAKKKKKKKKEMRALFGRGNAKAGARVKYKLFKPSTVFQEHVARPRAWNNFCRLLDVRAFLELCDKIRFKWSLPRNGGWEMRARKHGLEQCMFACMGILSTGVSDLTMQSIAGMSAGLVGVEFERIILLLDEALDDLYLMDGADKAIARGTCESNPNIVYFLDGCDIAVEELKQAWLWKTHKKNIKNHRAARAQIVVDSQLSVYHIHACFCSYIYIVFVNHSALLRSVAITE